MGEVLKSIIRINLLFLIFVSVLSCSKDPVKTKEDIKVYSEKAPYVLLISIDGFRHDYIDMYNPPNLRRFMQGAAVAESLIPVYPSNTFPNHYSIITGSYPENSGIINNSFYDPELGKEYTIAKSDTIRDADFYKRKPLWEIAQDYGITAASYFWLSSDVAVNGKYPKYYRKFNMETPGQDIIDQAVSWFKMPKAERPKFMTIYFSAVDSAGHKNGPDSDKVKETISTLDAQLGGLFEELDRMPFPVNVFIVSDHGMQVVEPEKVIDISDPVAENAPEVVMSRGSIVQFYEKDSAKLKSLKEAVEARIAEYASHLNVSPEDIGVVYYRKDIPEKYKIKKSKRAGDLIVDAKLGYYFNPKKRTQQIFEMLLNKCDLHTTKSFMGEQMPIPQEVAHVPCESLHAHDSGSGILKAFPKEDRTAAFEALELFEIFLSKHATHGWDPDKYKKMHGIFMAKGPLIKPGKVSSFKNVHIYPLILKLLGLEGKSQHDGDFKVLEKIYNPQSK